VLTSNRGVFTNCGVVMKILKSVTLWIVLVLCCIQWADVAFGQTPPACAPVNGIAQIPYEFWIAGTLLPAGNYSISPSVPSVVVFWNAKHDIGKQAFLMPTGGSVASGQGKLIFLVHDGKHYLRAIWLSDGKAVLTSEFHLPLAAGDTETEVKLLEQKRDDDVVRARQ
jgi:hypothetical protein